MTILVLGSLYQNVGSHAPDQFLKLGLGEDHRDLDPLDRVDDRRALLGRDDRGALLQGHEALVVRHADNQGVAAAGGESDGGEMPDMEKVEGAVSEADLETALAPTRRD